MSSNKCIVKYIKLLSSVSSAPLPWCCIICVSAQLTQSGNRQCNNACARPNRNLMTFQRVKWFTCARRQVHYSAIAVTKLCESRALSERGWDERVHLSLIWAVSAVLCVYVRARRGAFHCYQIKGPLSSPIHLSLPSRERARIVLIKRQVTRSRRRRSSGSRCKKAERVNSIVLHSMQSNRQFIHLGWWKRHLWDMECSHANAARKLYSLHILPCSKKYKLMLCTVRFYKQHRHGDSGLHA